MHFAIASLLLMTSAFPALADSLWNHNGSIMHLQQDGEKRFMYYAQPRQGMLEAGVTPGTLFFDGVRQGDELIGTARVFSSKCPAPMTFSISGPIYNDGRIVLEGMRPVFKNCRATGEMKFDRLEFSFIENFVPEFEAGSEQESKKIDTDSGSQSASGSELISNKVDVAALMKAGMAGDASAFKELARIFAEGDGVAKSEERSINFLKKAAELGDKNAQAEWAAIVMVDPTASAADQEQAATYVLGQADRSVAPQAVDAGDVGAVEAEPVPAGIASEPAQKSETVGFSDSSFKCIATGCEQLTSAQSSEIVKTCNNVVALLSQEGYIFEKFEHCLLTDVGGQFSIWAQASGPEVISVSIDTPSGGMLSFGANLGGYPPIRDCWTVSLESGDLRKTSEREEVNGSCP